MFCFAPTQISWKRWHAYTRTHSHMRKVKGQPLPWDGVMELDLYGDKDPESFSGSAEDDIYYVFTRLKMMGEKRVVRMAGCGTWKVQTGRQGENNVIGNKRSLVFEVKEDQTERDNDKGHWIMHEISLAGVSLIDHCRDYAVCKIGNKDTKALNGGLQAVERNLEHDGNRANDDGVGSPEPYVGIASNETQELNAKNLIYEEETQQRGRDPTVENQMGYVPLFENIDSVTKARIDALFESLVNNVQLPPEITLPQQLQYH